MLAHFLFILALTQAAYPKTTVRVVELDGKSPICNALVIIETTSGEEIARGMTDKNGLFVTDKVDPALKQMKIAVFAAGNAEDSTFDWKQEPIVFPIGPKPKHVSQVECAPAYPRLSSCRTYVAVMCRDSRTGCCRCFWVEVVPTCEPICCWIPCAKAQRRPILGCDSMPNTRR